MEMEIPFNCLATFLFENGFDELFASKLASSNIMQPQNWRGLVGDALQIITGSYQWGYKKIIISEKIIFFPINLTLPTNACENVYEPWFQNKRRDELSKWVIFYFSCVFSAAVEFFKKKLKFSLVFWFIISLENPLKIYFWILPGLIFLGILYIAFLRSFQFEYWIDFGNQASK